MQVIVPCRNDGSAKQVWEEIREEMKEIPRSGRKPMCEGFSRFNRMYVPLRASGVEQEAGLKSRDCHSMVTPLGGT